MKGLLIYADKDVERNASYIEWWLEASGRFDLKLELITAETLFKRGFQNIFPDFAINRSRSYELSLYLELVGVRVFNSSRVTLLGNNKLAQYDFAKNIGLDFPELTFNWSEQKRCLISKPVFGHGGEGICWVEEEREADKALRIRQRYVEHIGDVRFYVLNDQILQAVLRRPEGKLVSNYSQGGSFELYDIGIFEQSLIRRITEALSIDYAGVDFLLTKEGELLFGEIEDVVGSRMLSALGKNDTTDRFLEHIRSELLKGA